MAESDRLIDAYIALRGQIARLVMRIVPPKEVEDIVQETYVRICRVDNQDAIREPRSYVFRTARNLALDHVKRSESRLTGGTDMAALPAEDSLLPSELDPTYAPRQRTWTRRRPRPRIRRYRHGGSCVRKRPWPSALR